MMAGRTDDEQQTMKREQAAVSVSMISMQIREGSGGSEGGDEAEEEDETEEGVGEASAQSVQQKKNVEMEVRISEVWECCRF
jgi:hypothetical protein